EPCPGVCDDVGACCVGTDCFALTSDMCDEQDGTFWAIGEPCFEPWDHCEAPDCGVRQTGDCFECHDPDANPITGGLSCNDEECCQAVCDIDPFCCEEDSPGQPGRGAPHWDANCVALAKAICDDGPPLSVCDSPLSGPCFTPHAFPGCSLTGCCEDICAEEPFCCQIAWDQICVELAFELCGITGSSPTTSSFTDAQGYLTGISYFGQWGGLPPSLSGGVAEDPCEGGSGSGVPFPNWDGTGFDMQGLWEFGELIKEATGSPQNLTRGKSIRVGVI